MAENYTTHDVARFCGVYPSSVINWINSGRLRTFQTAGGHHRVTREDLVAFLSELRAPIPAELRAVRRVLVVDDDAEVAELLARALSRLEGVELEVRGDGVDALIRIGQAPPEMVVLDLELPKMDGLQVCRVLKAKPETRDIKIVLVSGKRLPMSEKRLREELKADAFFRKPLDVAELLARAGELLGAPAGEVRR